MLNRALCDSPNDLAYQRNRLVQSRQPSEARILMLTGFSFMTSISHLDPKQTRPHNTNISAKLLWILQPNSCFSSRTSVQPAAVHLYSNEEERRARREALTRDNVMCPPTTHSGEWPPPPRSTSEGHSCTSVRPLRNVSLSGILLFTMMLEVSS